MFEVVISYVKTGQVVRLRFGTRDEAAAQIDLCRMGRSGKDIRTELYFPHEARTC